MAISTDMLTASVVTAVREHLISPRVARPLIIPLVPSVCNCKRSARPHLVHALCVKRGGSFPPKATRDRNPEIRLAGSLLPRDRFLERAPVADSPRQAQPVPGDDRETGQGSGC